MNDIIIVINFRAGTRAQAAQVRKILIAADEYRVHPSRLKITDPATVATLVGPLSAYPRIAKLTTKVALKVARKAAKEARRRENDRMDALLAEAKGC